MEVYECSRGQRMSGGGSGEVVGGRREGQRVTLLRTSWDKAQEKLVKKLDQATFINSLPKVKIVKLMNYYVV